MTCLHQKAMSAQCIPIPSAVTGLQTLIQSGLNISESVILTNSDNDANLVGTNFFQRYFNPLLRKIRIPTSTQ